MARACKWIGATALLLGLVLTAISVSQIARDDAYRKAALVASRNPGNVLYEAEFKGAQVRRAFQIFGAFAGGLLGLNGVTLMLLGVVAGRVPKDKGA
jgi:hypothetical protein